MTVVDHVHIRRLRANYIISHGHPRPRHVQQRLDHIIQKDLAEALNKALEPLARDHTGEIWFIRCLTVDLTCNADHPSATTARNWARHIGQSIATKLASADGAVCFASRADYLASFLDALADDSVWDKWYFRPFEGIRLLTPSAALRTVLLREPDAGWQALAQLKPGVRRRLLCLLEEPDASLLLGAMVDDRAPESRDAWDSETLAARWIEMPLMAELAARPAARALAFIWGLPTLPRQRPPSPIVDLALALSQVGEPSASPASPRSKPRDDGKDRSRQARRRILQGAGPNGRKLLRKVRTAGQDLPIFIESTPFGGIFLLLPHLAECDFPTMTAGWPSCGDAPPADVLRLFVAAACFGKDACENAITDRALRHLLAVPEELSLDDLRGWMRNVGTKRWRSLAQSAMEAPATAETDNGLHPPYRLVTGRHARAAIAALAASMLRRMARRLPGFASASAPHLQRNFLLLPAQVMQYGAILHILVQDPPLGIVLRLTGAIRGAIRPAWAPDREIRWAPKEDGP